MIEVLLTLARARRSEGNVDESLSLYRQVAALARRADDAPALVHALRHVSDIVRAHDPREAARVAEEAIAVCRANPDWSRLEQANALRLKALAWAEVNESARSTEAWTQARALYDEAGINAGVEECNARLEALS